METWNKYIEKVSGVEYRIKKGFVPNMKVEGRFFVNDDLLQLLKEEYLDNATRAGGGFLPAVRSLSILQLLARPVTLRPIKRSYFARLLLFQ